MQASIVAKSRISPTMMMSGSIRIAAFSAGPKPSVSIPTSRWTMQLRSERKRNSTGVLDRDDVERKDSFKYRSIEASVVDLPLPVGPVTRISPFGARAISPRTGGSRSFLERADLRRDHAHHDARAPRCRKMLTRKRAPFSSEYEASSSRRSSGSVRRFVRGCPRQ